MTLVNTAADVICCDVPGCDHAALVQGREVDDWRIAVIDGVTFLLCPDHFVMTSPSLKKFSYQLIVSQILEKMRDGEVLL